MFHLGCLCGSEEEKLFLVDSRLSFFRPSRKSVNKLPKGVKTQGFCHTRREEVGGKPAKTGGDGAAAAKERPKEAPFAALRHHDYRLRTWNRTPAAKPTRPQNFPY